ncbi:cytochrome P450 4C1-like [Zerene cesonia]|uniref:cytochrome P450 4C1-like n=1 Tax=Zerene cesonia TaxID=33412 RepID=UPI0018E50BE2|nr:cytochrome P450 4C1-like [Zerene cesonia]
MFYELVVCMVILMIWSLWRSEKSDVDNLPGPPRWPIVGSLPIFLGLNESEIFTILTGFSKEYGHRVRLKIFNSNVIHLYDPKDIEIVLTNSKNITKSKGYLFLKPWLGTGLLISTGTKWHKRRKILTPAFHFDILKNFARVFEEESRALVGDLRARLQRGERTLDVMAFISDYTLYAICETAMGIRLNSEISAAKSEYKKAILGIGQAIYRRLTRFWLYYDIVFYLTPTGRQFKKHLEQICFFTNTVIEEKRKKKNETESSATGKRRMALLDLLLDAESKGEIDMEGIRDEVNTFMFEGHDTTALALTFGLMLLADHEDVQEKMFEECKITFGDSTRTANTSDLAEMKYLDAVIKEVLRLYPSVPLIGREITEELVLDDLVIPRDYEVIIHIYELQRRGDLFPDPEVFRPERFLNGDKTNFSYLPFSAGPRNCIGQRFAMQEMKCMLSEIVRNFKLSPIEKGYRPSIKADLVLRPNEPVLVKFSSR